MRPRSGSWGATPIATAEQYQAMLDRAGAGGTARERGRYLLAATSGNVHIFAPGNVKLYPSVLADGQKALAAAHPGAQFQYVFDGGSGSAPGEIRKAVACWW